MNYAACGPMNCFHSETPIDENALKIAFPLLNYHPNTSRKLNFNEYKLARSKSWCASLHYEVLYILTLESTPCFNSKSVEILFYVSDGVDLQRLCNLKWLKR